MNTIDNLMDEEGENQALRMFLAYYGGACGVSVGKMQAHLRMAGFNGAWPEWCNEPNEDKQHLTKAGAQLWIRHLISLEALAQPIDTSPERVEKSVENVHTPDPMTLMTDESIMEAAQGWREFDAPDDSSPLTKMIYGGCRAVLNKYRDLLAAAPKGGVS